MHHMTNDHDKKTDSGAWTSGSGAPTPETEVPPPSNVDPTAAPPRTDDDGVGPDISPHGSDPESPVSGMAKQPSRTAEVSDDDAPPPGPRDF